MKILCLNRKQNRAIMLIMAVLLLFFVGVALGASEEVGESHGETHGEAHGEAHGAKGWVATDTFRVLNFAVLAIGLFFLLKKPVSQALNARIKGIQDQLGELEAKKKEAEEKLAEYDQKLTLLGQEADSIVEQYIQQGKEAKTRILEEAKSAADKLEDQARRNIENEFKKAKAKLQEDILEKALVKAEQLIKNKITNKDQDKLVDEYLKKVVA